MADTPRRFFGPATLGNSAATLFTVPAGATALIRYMRIVNGTGSDVPVYLTIGADNVGRRFFDNMTIPGGAALDWSGFLVLGAGEIMQGFAGTAGTLTLIVTGVEVT